MKTIKRNWLKKQVELGKVVAKCELHLTDDYAFDNANDFGKTEWKPAYIRRPKFESFMLDNGAVIDRCVDHDHQDGKIALMDHQFEGKSGWAGQDDSGLITFHVHSNLYYTLKVN